ncbi:nucleic acid-binding protein, partial [Candidatus Bathyarchaeota archaeon]|nr:nucleic acid-binding protein [Candidatus Bathyarchaeota archaeon]
MSVSSFREGLKESKLLGCVCEGCDNLMLPPRMICNKCGSTNLKEHC